MDNGTGHHLRTLERTFPQAYEITMYENQIRRQIAAGDATPTLGLVQLTDEVIEQTVYTPPPAEIPKLFEQKSFERPDVESATLQFPDEDKMNLFREILDISPNIAISGGAVLEAVSPRDDDRPLKDIDIFVWGVDVEGANEIARRIIEYIETNIYPSENENAQDDFEPFNIILPEDQNQFNQGPGFNERGWPIEDNWRPPVDRVPLPQPPPPPRIPQERRREEGMAPIRQRRRERLSFNFRRVKENSFPETQSAILTKNAITFGKFQIILRIYRSPSEIVQGFDIQASKILAYKPEGSEDIQFWGTQSFYLAMKHLSIWTDPERQSRTYILRLFKYFMKGFDVLLIGLDRSLIDHIPYTAPFEDLKGMAWILRVERRILDNPGWRWRLRDPKFMPSMTKLIKKNIDDPDEDYHDSNDPEEFFRVGPNNVALIEEAVWNIANPASQTVIGSFYPENEPFFENLFKEREDPSVGRRRMQFRIMSRVPYE